MVNTTDYNFFHSPEKRDPFSKTMFNSEGRLQFCPYDNSSLNSYQKYKQDCLKDCNKACNVESYSMDPNILDYGSDMNTGTTIIISWSPEAFTYIEHKERMDLPWFLGNIGKALISNYSFNCTQDNFLTVIIKLNFFACHIILGGQLHIWLSLSVINLIRYLINLLKTGEFFPSTSCCCMLYWWKLVLSRRREQISLN